MARSAYLLLERRVLRRRDDLDWAQRGELLGEAGNLAMVDEDSTALDDARWRAGALEDHNRQIAAGRDRCSNAVPLYHDLSHPVIFRLGREVRCRGEFAEAHSAVDSKVTLRIFSPGGDGAHCIRA